VSFGAAAVGCRCARLLLRGCCYALFPSLRKASVTTHRKRFPFDENVAKKVGDARACGSQWPMAQSKVVTVSNIFANPL